MSAHVPARGICFDRILPDDLARLEELEARTRSPEEANRVRMAVLGAKKWQPGQHITVAYLDGLPDVQERVTAIAKEWERYANLDLDFVEGTQGDIRISFQQSGSWSYLGTDANNIGSGDPTMNYGWLDADSSETEYRRVVLHEFGHALGAIHEHQNPVAGIPWDKEAVYARYTGPPNNWSRAQVDNNLFRRYAADITQFTEFDPDSIMLYAISNELTVGDFEVGWNTELSDKDKSFMAQLYPAGANQAVEIGVDGSHHEATIGTHGSADLYRFELDSSGPVTIETHGEQDLVITLSGPDSPDRVIGQDDDGGVGTNPKLHLPLDEGTYWVQVRHYWPTSDGRYEISVSADA